MMNLFKRIFLVSALLICIGASAQATFEKDFSSLETWKGKASDYSGQATQMMLLIWVGGVLTLASATMPFVDRKPFKLASFCLALIGAAMTQYLVTFQVDPKMISQKARIMEIMIQEFEIKVRDSELSDPNIAKQLMLEKRQLEVKLLRIEREIQGVNDVVVAFNNQPKSNHIYQAGWHSYQAIGSCALAVLDPENGDLKVNGRKMEISATLMSRMKEDKDNLYVTGSSQDPDLNKAILLADSCLMHSIQTFLSPGNNSNENKEILASGVLKLSEVLYTNYKKMDDQSYQAIKIISIPKSAAIGYYSDLYGNYEKKDYKKNEKQVRQNVNQEKVIDRR